MIDSGYQHLVVHGQTMQIYCFEPFSASLEYISTLMAISSQLAVVFSLKPGDSTTSHSTAGPADKTANSASQETLQSTSESSRVYSVSLESSEDGSQRIHEQASLSSTPSSQLPGNTSVDKDASGRFEKSKAPVVK